MATVFWFEAQTGVIHEEQPLAPSNYYRYCLDSKYMPRVIAEVESAGEVGPSGLEFSPEFLRWLDIHDEGTGA